MLNHAGLGLRISTEATVRRLRVASGQKASKNALAYPCKGSREYHADFVEHQSIIDSCESHARDRSRKFRIDELSSYDHNLV